jgi:hypothetical protein
MTEKRVPIRVTDENGNRVEIGHAVVDFSPTAEYFDVTGHISDPTWKAKLAAGFAFSLGVTSRVNPLTSDLEYSLESDLVMKAKASNPLSARSATE